ncbi:MAG: hypothetical protein O9345_11565 [Burkholderiaceae bacterium]|nr:hypothetical protein [Burkholderiales bacterium]MCZ8109088.1 hypothetical protein [Burkholderiales bacterium]MCZ8338772.1 hypothetical protein [Burkholderiaceae bacterium]
MRSAVPPPFRVEGRGSATRLWLARAIAWSLLLGGWLTLGALGHEAALAGAWPGMPLAAWLASIGALLAAGSGMAITMRALAIGLFAAAIVAASSLARVDGASPLPLVGAAFGWGALLVLSSRTVKALRAALPRRTPAPIGPALVGACIAWAVAGDTGTVASRTTLVGLFLLAASLALVALRPRGAPPATGCRAGLFDCALPLPHRGWGTPRDWPMHAAALSMLPTMAAFGPMAQLCAGDRLGPASVGALHLAAMLVPAWLLRRPLAHCPRAVLSGIVASLLAAGGMLVAFDAHRDALLAGMLVHAVAWSLAWAGPMLERDVRAHPPSGRAAAFGIALGSAALVAALAAAVTASGEQALRVAHLALAAFALGALWPASVAGRGATTAP